jgi:hypothetical protein
MTRRLRSTTMRRSMSSTRPSATVVVRTESLAIGFSALSCILWVAANG